MNLERFEIKTLEVESYQTRQVLRCLLHHLLFNRAPLDCILTSAELECDVFDVPVPYSRIERIEIKDRKTNSARKISYTDAHRYVDDKIETFCQGLDRSKGKKGTMSLSFTTTKVTSGLFDFFKSEEKVEFERWIIPITVIGQPPRRADRERVKLECYNGVVEQMLHIIKCVNEKHDHIPPRTNSISFVIGSIVGDARSRKGSLGGGQGGERDGWLVGAFKKMLKDGPPSLNL
jgi:autophagy-related protein 101